MITSAFKNALLPLISYRQPTLPADIASAIDVAAALKLRLVGLDVHILPPVAAGFGAYAMPILGTTIDAEDAKTKANAEAIAQDFLTLSQHRGVAADLRRVTSEAIDGPGLIAATARLFDLTILSVAPGSRAARELAEAVVFGSGRPCLLLPQKWVATPALFDRPLVAWDASRAATRALADALPMLQRAADVNLIIVAPEQSEAARSAPDVERWLKDHGVCVTCARIDGAGDAATAIAEYALGIRANLIVMGAFGHSRLRDFILGGVTRSVLAEPRLPVLFSH
ncbi:MAG: universal stress protein [Beijerinckiaceae bacterium]|nr:universal stress protein [Beijerinckiaceae bacterium]